MQIKDRLYQYALLMRLNKPIGALLLLWPTLWALWLASHGHPQPNILIIFIVGVILMRSAGCAANDFADRHVDGQVERTKHRPLASGKLTSKEALIVTGLLLLASFLLVLQCNLFTIQLAFIGAALALIYPFMKRYTHLPQLGLGAAFAWGIPMAFAAETNAIPTNAWFLFFTALLWPVIYDTMYAMVDRNDDEKAGIKSTAILFGQQDKLIIGILQIIFLAMLVITGFLFNLSLPYYISLIVVLGLFIYQQWLIRDRDRGRSFTAFLNNNWVGLVIFIGIVLSNL
ncbi:MAG: 4-hydroxybenzoate octaprenyltransferase [Gammaproteobacteria bacterium]